ncbi:acyltransferase family protein [Rugamonas rivuli]|uniref:Acyltransferase family protein n=1 Tax=Rugamonas rivuli TaxID=2743358 RepID=A0A843SCU8_9BURK|nr:acyltransferase [Rugamonas rivuli]MQA20013.1 acyltransferase family protein [Rugamonas rivuli]
MKKYHGIQILRFAAASLVVAEHLIGNVVNHWANAGHYEVPPLGLIGVIVFFGISGFIMVTTQYDAFGSVAKSADFFFRRMLRILPVYAIATTMQFINKFNAGEHYTIVNYFKSLLFVPYIGDKGFYRPILGQGWTLNLEMFFYLVFALSLILPRMGGMALSIAVFVAFAATHSYAAEMNVVLAFYMQQILLFFACGMLIATLCKHVHWRSASVASPLVICLALMAGGIWVNLYLPEGTHLAYNLVMVSACVWAAASYQPVHTGKTVAILERLGDASFSTYLFHGFMLGAIKFLSYRTEEGQWLKFALLLACAVILANLVGLLMYRFVEHPIARVLKGWTQKPHTAQSKPPQQTAKSRA